MAQMTRRAVRTGRNLTLAVLFAGLLTAPALAQNATQSVPLPKPRPISSVQPAQTGEILSPLNSTSPEAVQQAVQQPATVQAPASAPSPQPASTAAKQPAQTQTPAQAPAAHTAQTQTNDLLPDIPNPFAALLGKPGNTVALDAKQRAIIKRVDNYLSSVRTLEGNFVQIGPSGHRSHGEFFIQKPGKVRFEYAPPSPIEIIADGQSVVVRDRSLDTQDVYPLSQTPLRFLLADNVDLLKDTNLVGVYADDVFVTVVVEEKNPLVGTSRLMIMFSANNMQLKQWTVTDPQGYDTTVAVSNLNTTAKPDPSLFHIDYTNYHN